MYLYNESKLNINITKDSTGRIYTIGSGSGYPQVNGSATLNVTVDGKNKSYVSSYNAVEITAGASKVRFEYNNLYGDMPTFSASLGKLAEGGYYEVIGAKAQFRSYAVPLWSTNKITTPTSDVKFKAQEISYSIFTDVLDSSDQPVTHIKVEGQSEKVDFSLIDSEVTLPDMKVGNKIAKYYIAEGLLGAHSNEVTCKIDYTKLPKGLNATDYSTGNGYIWYTYCSC